MKKILILSFLIILWLLMSGLYKTLILIFGLCSVFLVAFFIQRMSDKDGYKININMTVINSFNYFCWFLVEVVKSNWAVAKILTSKKILINQYFIETSVSQESDLAKVIFANSITLTPGTVTVETEDKRFLVHILNKVETTISDLQNMNNKVTKIERVK